MTERLISAVTAAVLATTGTGLALSPTDAKAETDNQTKIVTEGSFPSEDALSQMGIKADAGVSDVTPTVDMSEPTGAPTPSKEDVEYTATIEALKSLGYSTEHYVERQKKIDECKEELKANECQEINLEACANWLYAIDESKGFSDTAFTHPEKTVLSNYVSRDEVIEFGRTGKVDESWNWKVIYHKDEKGKLTKEPGLMYAFNPENKVFSTKDVQAPIDWWEDRIPGYFRVLNKNCMWVTLQSNACDSSNEVTLFKYGDNILYYNYSSSDSDLTDFQSGLFMASYKEQFGIMGDALWGRDNGDIVVLVGVTKAIFATKCFEYADKTIDDKFVTNAIVSSKMETDSYIIDYGMSDSIDKVYEFVNGVESKNLFIPFCAATWAEIDSANVTAKNN